MFFFLAHRFALYKAGDDAQILTLKKQALKEKNKKTLRESNMYTRFTNYTTETTRLNAKMKTRKNSYKIKLQNFKNAGNNCTGISPAVYHPHEQIVAHFLLNLFKYS